MKKANSKIVRTLFTFSAVWGLIAGLAIFFIPFGMRVTETGTSTGSGAALATPVSFFETQSWWGIWILLVFAALYYGPLHFYRRGSKAMAALFAMTAILLTFLAGFSIGPFYLVGALALLAGLTLLPFLRSI